MHSDPKNLAAFGPGDAGRWPDKQNLRSTQFLIS